jgi:hypothetical protein
MERKNQRSKEQAITALLTYPTVEEAARALGMSEEALRREKQDPEFQRAYDETRRQMAHGAVAGLQASAAEAVQALRKIMNSEAVPPHNRIAAARTVLEHAVRATELEELVSRLAVLEERVAHYEMELKSKER